MTRDQLIANQLYCGYIADELTDSDVRRACAEFGITYPPQLHTPTGTHNEHSLHDLGPVRHRKNHQPTQPQPC